MEKLKNQLLTLLEKNGRLTPKDLAILVNEKEEIVAQMVATLEKDGVICGYQP